MKITLVVMLLALVGMLSGVGMASVGGPPPPGAGVLVLLGSGLVGFAIWGRRKFRR